MAMFLQVSDVAALAQAGAFSDICDEQELHAHTVKNREQQVRDQLRVLGMDYPQGLWKEYEFTTLPCEVGVTARYQNMLGTI